MRLRIFVVDALAFAFPVLVVPPEPAVLPPVLAFAVVVETIEPEFERSILVGPCPHVVHVASFAQKVMWLMSCRFAGAFFTGTHALMVPIAPPGNFAVEPPPGPPDFAMTPAIAGIAVQDTDCGVPVTENA